MPIQYSVDNQTKDSISDLAKQYGFEPVKFETVWEGFDGVDLYFHKNESLREIAATFQSTGNFIIRDYGHIPFQTKRNLDSLLVKLDLTPPYVWQD